MLIDMQNMFDLGTIGQQETYHLNVSVSNLY